MKQRFLLAAVAAVSVTHAGSGWAQAFLSDPRVANGMGVKAGDFELHPGVAGEVGYDSNYFQRKGDSTSQVPGVAPPNNTSPPEPVIGAYRLRVTPSLSFETFGRRTAEEGGGPPPTVKFRGKLAAGYNALFASDSAYSSQVSNQSNYVSGNAGLGLDILPEHTWGSDLSGDFTRVIEASNDADTANAFRRDTVRGGVGINFRPGGGLFKWRLGYGITANLFEDDGFKNLNNVQHRGETSGMWTFLPRTALIYRGELAWVNFTNGGPNHRDGETVRSQIGLNGLFTNHWGFLGLVGWGATFFEGARAQNEDTVIGQAEITWYPTPSPKLGSVGTEGAPVGLSSVSVGYNRNFAVSYLGDYYRRDRAYAGFSYFLANRFVFTLSGGLSFISRPPVLDQNNVNLYVAPNGEKRVDGVAFLEYRPGDAVGVNLTFRYDAELDHAYVATDDLKFSRYQAFLGLRWFL